jgi:hypothetical protein|tara:strand:- start:362 stop:703 length:342 start_codon:yes stop_codon:yes gene_type:complete
MLGDCYEAAIKFIMSKCMFGPDCPFSIVHAEVSGQGPLEGVSFGHAYVVDKRNNIVIDTSNGRNVMLGRAAYESMGKIDKIGNYHEYAWHEARKKIIDYEHYGPWDLETSTGL